MLYNENPNIKLCSTINLLVKAKYTEKTVYVMHKPNALLINIALINIIVILGTFMSFGISGSIMIVNGSSNLVEFYVKMGKMNCNLQRKAHVKESLRNYICNVMIALFWTLFFG